MEIKKVTVCSEFIICMQIGSRLYTEVREFTKCEEIENYGL